MNKSVLLLVDAISNERGLKREMVFEAIQTALQVITADRYDGNPNIKVSIDTKTGNYETIRIFEVVEDSLETPDDETLGNETPDDETSGNETQCDEAPDDETSSDETPDDETSGNETPDYETLNKFDASRHVKCTEARKTDETLNVGDFVEELVESVSFGRIAAQQARRIIFQKVREAEKSAIAEKYANRVGEIVVGVVKKVAREFVVIDLGGNAEAILYREEMIPRESFRINDRVRSFLYSISDETKGAQLLVSRVKKDFLIELFKIEVPEIGEEIIEIRASARDPGFRAKIAVKTNDGRVDAVGACVGMRGSRVQAVSNELNGEKIDIVNWDPSNAQLVINTLSPAEVISLVVDEDARCMDIAVDDAHLSQAIGRNGQNVKLASMLCGWRLNIMSAKEMNEKTEDEVNHITQEFMSLLGIDEKLAQVLVADSYRKIEEIAYISTEELAALDGFDEKIALEVQQKAQDILLEREIGDSGLKEAVSQDVNSVNGVNDELASLLISAGIDTRDKLAEHSVKELQDVVNLSDKKAADVIMAAREHWFDE